MNAPQGPKPSARRRTRRRLLADGVGVLTTGVLLGPRWKVAFGSGSADRVLVVLQLSGGNDGLNTVVPHAQDALYRARPRLAIPQREVIPLAHDLGLNPALASWRTLWDAGQLALVLGAGYPRPNRSHFKSMDIWHAASPDGRARGSGWLGRALDEGLGRDGGLEAGLHVGARVPYALASRAHPAISLRAADAYRWMGREEEHAAFEALSRAPGEGPVAPWLHEQAENALASSAAVRRAISRYEPKAHYPQRGSLGRSLSVASALICGGLPVRVLSVELGGFDTHSAQRARQDDLLRELAGATSAFLADLAAHGAGDRVALFAFSEFGRRVAENASGGTDHGTASCSFLLGARVAGGLLGQQPDLTALDSDGDLLYTTDFRRIYAGLLEGWLGVPAESVLGPGFPPLPLFAGT